MDGAAFGRALAYAIGDMRDWPPRCAFCESERVEGDLRDDALVCLDCRRKTARAVAYRYQVARARREVMGS